MLKDVVIHISNEQPILADLAFEPQPGDMALICTNIRTLNGKTPIFVESANSTFVFPMVHVRFVEIKPGSGPQVPEGEDAVGEIEPSNGRAAAGRSRRRGSASVGAREPATAARPDPGAAAPDSEDDETDASEFLRRVKEL